MKKRTMLCRIALLFLYMALSLAVNANLGGGVRQHTTKLKDKTNCYIEGKTKDYDGNISQTINGEKCLNWAACPKYEIYTDTEFSYIGNTVFPDGSVTAALNYCRDPDSTGIPWCLSGKESHRCTFRYCAVNPCNTDCYVEGQSKEYRGNLHTTADGLKCMDWNKFGLFEDVKFPDGSAEKALNYCRDPDETGRPWCFGTDGHMDKCAVPVC